MKRALAALALSTLSAFGQQQQLNPGDYRNFYVPQNWKQPTVEGTLFYVDNKQVKTRSYTLTPDGNGGYAYDVTYTGASALTATETALEAAVVAAKAYAEAKYAQESVDQFAKTLYQLLAVQGVTITDKSGDKMTIKFDKNSIGRAMQDARGGGNIEASTDSEFEDEPITDDKTIGVSSNQRLQIWGAESATASTALWWDDLGFFVPTLKGVGSIVWKKYGGYDANVFATEGDNKVLSLKDFYLLDNENVCQENLNQLLTETSDTQRGMHYIICRYGVGSGATFHYLPIGDRLPGVAACDNASITTNETGVFHIVGVSGAVSGQVLSSDGSSGVDWVNPSPVVAYDDTDAYFTITPGGNDDSGATYVYLPYLSIEETEDGYTFTYRQVNSEVEEEVTIPAPKATNTFDNVTVNLNGDGKLQIKGYADNLTGDKYVGTDHSGTWGVHSLPSVTTNAVDGDDVTIEAVTVDGVKYLGLKGWPQSGGPFAVSYQNGALAYLPFPDGGASNAVGIAVDNVSISSNADHKVEIKGFSSSARNCDKDTADLLVSDTDDTDDHQFLARAGTGSQSLHYVSVARLPHPDSTQFSTDGATKRFKLVTEEGKLLQGASGNGITWVDPPSNNVANVVDEHSIVTNSTGKVSLAGFWDSGTSDDMVPVKRGNSLSWTNYTSSATKVDGHSIVTNAPSHVGEVALAGFWDGGTENGMVPVKNGNSLSWTKIGGGAAIRLAGSDGSSVVFGGGATTNSISFVPDAGANVTIKVTGDDDGNATVAIGVYYR